MADYILAIDQGTTGSTAVLMNSKGGLIGKQNVEFPQVYPKPGWVEHNPDEIWKSVEVAVSRCIQASKVKPSEITAIGITNQRETALVWSRETGESPYNAIVWQCRRTSEQCDRLKKARHEKQISNTTGLLIDPYFSATKFNWFLKNVKGLGKDVKSGKVIGGNVDAFLIWKLTGGESFKTDVTNASRTQLMNLKKLTWDQKMLELFEVPEQMLPEIVPSSTDFGKTKGLSFLPDGIPILGVAGDQQAALFGQACFGVGEAKCTYGTGSFLLLNTGKELVRSKSGLLTTLAWQLEGQDPVYALEGAVFICGAAVQWLRDGLGIIQKSSEIEALAKEVTSSEGVEFVPALTGLGAPHWMPHARGMITGLTRGSTKAHIARATLEAMALQNLDILDAMQKDLGKKLKALKVDGGAAENNLLMQIQSDYLGVQTERPELIETTAIGAAYLAGLRAGLWKNTKELAQIWKTDRKFKPQMKARERTARIAHWHEAIRVQKA